jgi:hypothetical protein
MRLQRVPRAPVHSDGSQPRLAVSAASYLGAVRPRLRRIQRRLLRWVAAPGIDAAEIASGWQLDPSLSQLILGALAVVLAVLLGIGTVEEIKKITVSSCLDTRQLVRRIATAVTRALDWAV